MSQFWRLLNKTDGGLLIAAALALFAIQPLLQPGLPTSADLTIHLYRALEFERAWAPGVIVPRWAPDLAYGYGYPLFVFAPPLPYLLAMAFDLPGVTLETAFKALIIFTILLYAIGMYLFAREVWGSPAAGLAASAAYTFAPFALREALLEGGNIPQLLAIGLFPWPLWAATRAARSGAWGWTVWAGIFYAAIMLSHLFQAFVFAPVLAAYTLLLVFFNLWGKSQKANTFSSLLPLFALPLGLLLSAFFWLPAFIERHFTRAQADIYLEKSPFFIRYPHWSELFAWIAPLDTRAANPYTPLTLGVVTLILAGLGLLVVGYLSRFAVLRPSSLLETQNAAGRSQNLPITAYHLPLTILFFAALAAGAAFMSIPASRPVWEVVSILQVAEFPWRMLGLANLGLALLSGGAILWLPRRLQLPAAGVCIGALLLGVAPYLYPVIPFSQHGQPTLADQIRYERSSQSIGTTTLGEYLPQTVAAPPTTSPLVDAYQAGQIPDRLDRASLPAGATATLLEQNAVTHRYQINSPAAFTLRLHHFYYPGWRAQIDGRPVELLTEAETGLMLINIPAGEHTLTVHFGEIPIRVIALSLTGLTLVALVAAQILRRRQAAAGRHSLTAINQKLPLTNYQLPITNPITLTTLALITLAALWLKPLLRPVFTIESPRQRVLPAQQQVDIRFSNGIQLAGYTLSRRVVEPGGFVRVTLYWQTSAAPHRVNLQPFVHLDRLDTLTTVAGATNYTPGDATTETNLPTFHWDNYRYIRDEHDLMIPPGTPPLAYAVRVGLIDPDQGGQLVPLADGSGDTAWLDRLNVSPGQPPEPPARPLNVSFGLDGDAIQLTGFELTGQTPQQLEFTLGWRSRQPPARDYTVFAQLLDANGQLVASFDRPPLDGAYPTSTWLPRQHILDSRTLPLEGVAPGSYTLIAGLYDSSTGRRMVTAEGVDFVKLAEITIKESAP